MGFIVNQNDKYTAIPEELKKLPNWICWKAVPDEKSHSGISKKPINPKDGTFAKSNDPSTWADFDTAVKTSERFSGIGFMFGDSEYFGVDLDDMPNDLKDYESGGSNNIIAEFIYELQSYAEYSQSKKGIHIICKGTLPKGGRKKKTSQGGFEMYETGRFFVMSGNPCSKYDKIIDCTESIKPLHAKYIGGAKEPAPKVKHMPNLNSASDIVKAACNAKNGDKFKALYSGDISAYGSRSEADIAFCNMLAFWTGCDADKMDAIFRQSGLMREKWERDDYRAATLQKAIAGCTAVYTPKSEYSINIKNSDDTSNDDTQAEFKPYTMDDMGNAQRLVDLFGEYIRYCYTDKRWYYYNSLKWCVDFDGTIERLADKAIEAMKAEATYYMQSDEEDGGDMAKAFQKHMKASRSDKNRKSMIAVARHHVPIMPIQLDRYKMALNTPSGVLNLKTGELNEHKPEYYLSKITSVEFSKNADCPRWKAFLDEIFGGDKDLVRYIQKAVGYTLTGSTAEQCAFFLYGTGRNGKSTFLDVIRDVFGDYASNIQPETIMVKTNTGSSANSDIARLKGARLVTTVEPNEGVRINEGLLKQLTGDDPVTARKLYSDEFEFKPEFKLWMATNHKPIIRGTDTGIWRRIHMIPFTVQIPEEKIDRNLKYKLKAEMTAIFKWCVDGCLMWQNEGLKMPKAVLDSVREYRREMDVISAFIDDRCQLMGSVQSSTLYAAYSAWAEENNEYKMSATKFGLEIAKRFEKVKTSKGQIFYNGISLFINC